MVTEKGVGGSLAYYAYPLYICNWMDDTFLTKLNTFFFFFFFLVQPQFIYSRVI